MSDLTSRQVRSVDSFIGPERDNKGNHVARFRLAANILKGCPDHSNVTYTRTYEELNDLLKQANATNNDAAFAEYTAGQDALRRKFI